MNRSLIFQKILESLDSSQITMIFGESRGWLDAEHIAEHAHRDLYQIDLFRGEGSATLADHRVGFRRWSLTFIPPGVPHSFNAAPGGSFRNIGIKALIKCAALTSVPAFGLAIGGSSFRLEQIHHNLQSILQEWQVRGIGSALLIKTHCTSLLVEVLRIWVEMEKQVPSQSIVQDACQYLALRYSETVTISQLARHCGVRPESLSRAFRRTIGVSPRRYITDLRITQARALLEAGASVTEAARQTGFTSLQYFSRRFSNLMNASPRQWLNQTRRPGAV